MVSGNKAPAPSRTTSKSSRSWLRFSVGRRARRRLRTYGVFSCMWSRAASAQPPSIGTFRHCGSFSGSRSSDTPSSSTRISFMSLASCRRAEPARGGAAARCRAGAQVQGGAERGLWRGPARRRSGLTQGLRHRQQADGHPRGAGQRPQGPQRHAVTASARPVARVVEGGATTRLAISGPRSGAADDDTPAQSRLPRCGSAGPITRTCT
jgi:hypothetical protein